MSTQPILINGQWRQANSKKSFHSENPATGEAIPFEYPISEWSDVDAALTAAVAAGEELRVTPPSAIGAFLTRFAERIEAKATDIMAIASQESGLPVSPRFEKAELPRTATQLRQGAAAALEGSWSLPTIDTKNGIRSYLAPLGPVAVFGPNNFPLAFNSVAGGDFVAAIAAGCPVIGKANTSHPRTTQVLAEEAFAALQEAKLPTAAVQLIYRTSHEDGSRLVADPRIGACAYTGSRGAGLTLKAAADKAGKPIYLELSSVNPVLMMPGALKERLAKCVEEYVDSVLMGTGQFCTNPSTVILMAGDLTEQFIFGIREKFDARALTPLLSTNVCKALDSSVKILQKAGAKLVTGGNIGPGPGYRYANTLLRVDGDAFLAHAEELQTEAFGNACLMIVVRDAAQALAILKHLEGNLTGCVYSDTAGSDNELYRMLVPALRARVGRLLNDKMPTGVALSPAMNHGGPYPSTGHPGFTAVGIPASLRRFGMLQSFDNIRSHRLPALLQNKNPNGKAWRLIDGNWSQGDVTA